MGMVLMLLGGVLCIVSLVCWLIILIDAFKNEVWKGIVGFLCGLYLLYYAIVEFQHDKKWLIIAGGFLGSAVGGVLMSMGTAASVAH